MRSSPVSIAPTQISHGFSQKATVSRMPNGPDDPESWIFHMAMAWMGESDNTMSYPERLAMIKKRAEGLGEPARSAFLWMPDDTEVHKADISYWVSQPWDNRDGRLTLVGDAAHPMPPCKSSCNTTCLLIMLVNSYTNFHVIDRGQGLNHCICDVSHLLKGLRAVRDGTEKLADIVKVYEEEMIPRGKEEVTCSVENGKMLHDWAMIQESPVFKRGFKPMDGHDTAQKEGTDTS